MRAFQEILIEDFLQLLLLLRSEVVNQLGERIMGSLAVSKSQLVLIFVAGSCLESLFLLRALGLLLSDCHLSDPVVLACEDYFFIRSRDVGVNNLLLEIFDFSL